MQGSLVNHGMKDISGLSLSNQTALDELALNGPLHLDQIPVDHCPKLGFGKQDVELLIRRGFATRIRVKNNPMFIAVVER